MSTGGIMLNLDKKIPPPLIATLCAIAMWIIAIYTPDLNLSFSLRAVIALLIVILGAFFSLCGASAFRRAKTTINPLRPETTSALVTMGIYQYSRNPMYVGFALFLLAFAILLNSPAALLGVFGFALYINRFQILPEERALQALFGEDFTNYRGQVRRWL